MRTRAKEARQSAFMNLFMRLAESNAMKIPLNSLRFMNKLADETPDFYASLTNSLDSANHF
ncbi:hypothetical protein CN878_00350 [Ochrobactrum sp. 695/2009]|nr:hypothetical protein CN881_13330 [Ochrobactrum sp. 721/2009]PJT16552.1 hypothetical protein CN880_09400 [Ochrobactrum sp. 720/2009]PJT26374.1 hypothetical protein CN879_05365 [Ochrobactrum sp. 715/2009]PJT31686.1 hypothetical protein CN878_00350 [Ochrobactrum sp. 695/2009]PJT35893.1 hypothetical protein CN877_07810 [Ochrobactrum sp. 689/2009]